MYAEHVVPDEPYNSNLFTHVLSFQVGFDANRVISIHKARIKPGKYGKISFKSSQKFFIMYLPAKIQKHSC
jgi:hypothetical protein